MDTRDQDEMARLRQLIMGFRTTQLIYVAAKLGLADHLARGPLTTHELASTAGADPGALHRLLRALASLGLFAERSDGRFEMTAAAELLSREHPRSLRSTAMVYGDDVFWRAYGRLSHAVETGASAFAHVHGVPLYPYLDEHPEAAALFHGAMTGFSELEATAIIEAYDFSEARKVVDVGGGQGALMAALLLAHAHLEATIFDRSAPTAETQTRFEHCEIARRANFIQGDFFTAVPRGGDLYVLKSVIHNWDDAAAARILENCRLAMPPHGSVLVAERVIPTGNGPSEAKLFDINMLVSVGGQERTHAQYATLFRAAGLELTKVTQTKSHLSLLVGIRADHR
jgi:hypothetical protein